MNRTTAASVDEYIAGYPPEVQEILNKIRGIIREAAPEAQESITYQIPTYKLNGRLVYFAAFKNHVSVYPRTTEDEEVAAALAPYGKGKGTFQFPLNKPIPYDLIERFVKARVKENKGKAGGEEGYGRAQ